MLWKISIILPISCLRNYYTVFSLSHYKISLLSVHSFYPFHARHNISLLCNEQHKRPCNLKYTRLFNCFLVFSWNKASQKGVLRAHIAYKNARIFSPHLVIFSCPSFYHPFSLPLPYFHFPLRLFPLILFLLFIHNKYAR